MMLVNLSGKSKKEWSEYQNAAGWWDFENVVDFPLPIINHLKVSEIIKEVDNYFDSILSEQIPFGGCVSVLIRGEAIFTLFESLLVQRLREDGINIFVEVHKGPVPQSIEEQKHCKIEFERFRQI